MYISMVELERDFEFFEEKIFPEVTNCVMNELIQVCQDINIQTPRQCFFETSWAEVNRIVALKDEGELFNELYEKVEKRPVDENGKPIVFPYKPFMDA